MKTLVSAISLLLLFALHGCKKNEQVVPAVDVQTKFPPPTTWKADETGKYPASMTAVVTLPPNLYAGMDAGDQLAAFINNECRGDGIIVKVGSSNLFFVLIRGLSDEQGKIKFKYYSAKTSFMYEAQPQLNFLVDDVFGNSQNPKVLELSPVK